MLKVYPDRRVEVDPPDAFPAAPPPNTPWLYLRDAARALRDCGSAPVLYSGWRGEDGRRPQEAMAYLEAPGRQAELARTSILFSAFAAEAYVNFFLSSCLGDRFSVVERDPTIEKYVRHAPDACSALQFTKGKEPVQGLTLLFRARNALAHPKAGVPLKPPVTPRLAAQSIVAVGRAAWDLTAELGRADLHAMAVAKQSQVFLRWAEVCAAGLPDLLDGPPEDLFILALNAEVGPALNRHMQATVAR